MNRRAILGCIAILAGCSTSGNKIDPSVISTFKPGVTTYDQIRAALGPPTVINRSMDGTLVIAYNYTQFRTNPAAFIPVVGLFAGGGSMQSETVSFIFGRDGILRDTSSHQAQTATGLTATPR